MSRSQELFEKAKMYIPGGVNSPVRACVSVGCDPLFIASAKGGTITSVDGDTYIDLVQSWGPMLLGHAHPEVNAAVCAAAGRGAARPLLRLRAQRQRGFQVGNDAKPRAARSRRTHGAIPGFGPHDSLQAGDRGALLSARRVR